MKTLIAGVGNVLLRDDGFGVEVARRLAEQTYQSTDFKIIDVGIGGIHLVLELLNGYDVLVIADASQQRNSPGTLQVLEAEVDDLADWTDKERSEFLADMHYTTPGKALVLARALGVLPDRVWLIGCQPGDISDLGIGLTGPVSDAADTAVRRIMEMTRPAPPQQSSATRLIRRQKTICPCENHH